MSKSVTDLMMERFEKPKKKGGIRGPFQDAVAQVQEQVTTVNWTFGRWCGYLRNIPPYEILSLLKQSRSNKTPDRLFFYLIKQYKNGEK